MAGASTTRCCGLTAEIFITARPRLPDIRSMPPSARKRVGRRAQHILVAAGRRRVASRPALSPIQERLGAVRAQALAEDGVHVFMQQAGVEQFADHEAGAAGRMEVVDVGVAVRVDAGQQRHHARQFVEVVPVDDDAGRLGDRHQVQRVVGRAAGGQQRDDRIDDGFFIDDVADRHVVAALRARSATARWAAAAVSASRSGVPGVMKAAPGRCRPMTSISIWLLLAVP